MRTCTIGTVIQSILLASFGLSAQTLSISGTVIDAQTSAAIQGATANLVGRSMTTTTDAQGAFSFQHSAVIAGTALQSHNRVDISLKAGVLRIDLPAGNSGKAVVDIFDTRGRTLFYGNLTGADRDGNAVRTSATGIASGGAWFARVKVAASTEVRKLITVGDQRAASFTFAADNAPLAKAGAAVIDSIVISKSGYQTRAVTLTSYQAQLGNVLLFKTGATVWTERILNGDGTMNWTEYERVANSAGGDRNTRDYLLGPTHAFYHPNPETFPTLALQGDADGWDGPASMKPPVANTSSSNGYYEQAGHLLYVTDDPNNGGVIEAAAGDHWQWNNLTPVDGYWHTLYWGLANQEGWYTHTNPPELTQFNNPTKPTAVASPTGIAVIPQYVAFQNGLIGTFPVCTPFYDGIGGKFPFVQLPAGKVPMALTATSAGEFVLAAVWDVVNHKGQVAVIAIQGKVVCSEPVYHDFGAVTTGTFMYGFPTWPTTKDMKLLGFVDLPIAAPTAIEAGTNLQWTGSGRWDQNVNKDLTTLLDDQNERDTWYNGSAPAYPNYKRTASAGYVVVASRSENKVVFVDLQPLLAYYRSMYFTTQARYDSTKNVGQAANQWPFAFDHRPAQTPVVAYTLDVPAPTAVAAGLSAGMCGGGGCPHCAGTGFWRASSFGDGYAYVTTMEGKLLMYTVGGLNTDAAATQPALFRTISIGRNPTSISHGNGGSYKNDLWINCRGDKSIYAFNAGGDQLYVLRDSRMQDPVMTENSMPHNSFSEDRNRVHVMDFARKQVLTYVYTMDFPRAMTFGAAADVPGYPFAYQQDEVP